MCGIMELVEASEVEIKRGRGRPRKEVIEVIEEVEPVIKKKGRPRKIVEDVEPVPKRPRGRPTVENPCKKGKPKTGNVYFREYYASKIKNCLISCPNCSSFTMKSNLGNHMKSQHCAKIANFIASASSE